MPETSEQKFPEKTVEALKLWIKLVTLANAGGIAATVAVIGATAKNGGFVNILAWPLGLFSLGVCLAILYASSYTLRIMEHDKWDTPPNWLISAEFMYLTGYGTLAFFVLGCISGVCIVAFAEPNIAVLMPEGVRLSTNIH